MRKVLSFGCHPDDIEIGCGGTEASLIKKGFEVYHAVITNGGEGDLSSSYNELSEKRREEAQLSARALQVKEVFFLGLEDGLTGYTKKDRKKVIALIREIQPDIVFTHSSFDLFPDHKIAHSLTLSALQAASGPWYRECGSQPHRVSHIFGYEVWSTIPDPSYYSDITLFVDKKMEALKCHSSQTSQFDYCSAIEGLARYRGAMSMKGKFAEAFETVRFGGFL